MSMRHCWNDTDRGKQEQGEKLSQYELIRRESHMDWSGIELELPR